MREKEYGLNPSPHSPRIIVSLTTFPDRLGTVHLSIRSMLVQTMKPDMIILYLGEDVDIAQLPESLTDMKRNGLIIEKRPGDIKPHKKYYYAIKEHPGDLIITIDDDHIYSNNLIEKLYKAHLRFPDCVAATRAHRIEFNADGSIKPYQKWGWEYPVANKPSLRLLATGCGGVLYPPNCMPEELFDIERLQALAYEADDLWLKAMQVLKGTRVVLCSQLVRLKRYLIPESQKISLQAMNVHQNRNDLYMDILIKHYGLTAEDFGYSLKRK